MEQKKLGKTALKRERNREALIHAAEQTMARKGLAGLKARDLADGIGVAVGQIYNLVSDLDELILRVSSHTLLRLEQAIAAALAQTMPQSAEATLIVIAQTYHHFARDNYHLWRTLFDHRLPDDRLPPDWVTEDRMRLFCWVEKPLSQLMTGALPGDVQLFSQTIFSAVHGMVSVGLDSRDVGVPQECLDDQISLFLHVICNGIAKTDVK